MAAPAPTIAHVRRSGIALGLGSAAAFATSGPFAKSLLDTGWSPGAAVTSRISLAAAVLALPGALAMRGRWHLVRPNAGTIVVYGLLAIAGCQLFYFNAVQTLSVGVALLLEYLGLILVVLWLWLRHGRRPGPWTALGVGLAVAGLVLVLDVTGGMEVDAAGVLWGLGAATGLATFFVISADDSTGLPPIAMASGGMVVAAITLGFAGSLGAMPMERGHGDVELAGVDLPWLVPVLGMGIVAAVFAYALGIAAARELGSKLAAFLGLTEVLFAVVFAWLLLDELPMVIQLAGGVLIIGGVAAVRYEELIAVGEDEPLAAEAIGVEPLPD